MKQNESIFTKIGNKFKSFGRKAVEQKEITVGALGVLTATIASGTTIFISNRDLRLRNAQQYIFTDKTTGISWELSNKLTNQVREELEKACLKKQSVADVLKKNNLI